MSDVFVSHVDEDAPVALDIAERLEAAGHATWCYELDSMPGGSYLLQTARGIERSRVVLVLISPASLGNVQVTKEIVRAHEADKAFLPVLHGLTHDAFQARAPEWRQAMGAIVSIGIGPDGVDGLVPKLLAALAELQVPRRPPAAERIARLARERDRRTARPVVAPGPEPAVAQPAPAAAPRRTLDVLLMALLLPVALFALGAYTWQLVGGRLAWVGVYVRADAGGGEPVVRAFWPGDAAARSGLRPGDTLVRLAGEDVRGDGPVALFLRAERLARALPGDGIPVVYRRGGETGEAMLPLVPVEYPWRMLPLGLALPVAGTLTLLRRPGSPIARLFFVVVTLFGLHWTWFFGGPGWLTATWAVVFAVASTIMFPLILRLAALTPEGIVPPAGVRWWSLAFAIFGPVVVTVTFGTPLPPALGVGGMWLVNLFVIPALLGVLSVNYGRATPIGRRQVKWVLIGLYVGLAPVLAADAIAAVDHRWWWLHDVAAIFEVAIPAGFLIALLRFNFLDVDRLISATIANTVLTFSFFVLTIVLVPRAADRTAVLMGVSPTVGSWIVTALLAAPLYPAYVYLRPRIDRLFFVERYALARGIDELLDALERGVDPEGVLRLAGARLNELLQPETCDVYGAQEAGFVRVFSAGRSASRAPGVFASDGEVVAVLARQPAVVDLQGRHAAMAGTAVGPTERAALAPLRAVLVLGVRREHELSAFVSLGRKRSGDVYTATEIGHLRTALEKISRELLRLDLGEHVPPQVMEVFLRDRRRLQPTRQEVTVLHAALTSPGTVPAEELARLRDEATEAVAAAVAAQEGLFETAMGQLRALWNAPVRVGDHRERACRAALAMQQAVAALGARWAERGWPALGLRVGIATGEAMVGNFPLGGRFHYGAEGACVDAAQQLATLNEAYGTRVLLVAGTRAGLGDDVLAREVDRVAPPGGEAAAVHELLGTRAGDADGRLRRLEDLFSRALAAYRAGDREDAARLFARLRVEYPDDGPSRVYAGRLDEGERVSEA